MSRSDPITSLPDPANRRATLANLLGVAGLVLASSPFWAAGPAQAATSDTGQGEVTKVDRDPPRLTIRHGELKALDMPAMTMAFRLQSPALADGVKPGDRVRFKVEKINGQYVLTQVETLK
jgi:Cu(I)/Ag(I) efflux system periplasmic protein CusF